MKTKKLGRWLKAERRKRGWTVTEMAAKIERHHTAVSHYERGTREVPFDVLRAYGKAFGIAHEVIMDLVDQDIDPDMERISNAYHRLPEQMRQLLTEYVIGWVDGHLSLVD